MKKISWIVCIGVLLTVMLFGCGKTESTQTDNIPEQTSKVAKAEEVTEESGFTYDDARKVYVDASGIWLPDAKDVEPLYGGSPDGRYYAIQFFGNGTRQLFEDSKALFIEELGVQSGEIDDHVRWTFPKDDGGSISYMLIYETFDEPVLTIVYQDSDMNADSFTGLDGGVIN